MKYAVDKIQGYFVSDLFGAAAAAFTDTGLGRPEPYGPDPLTPTRAAVWPEKRFR